MTTKTKAENITHNIPVSSPVNTGWTLKKWLYSLGPGLITAALVFGPSKITIASKMGAVYGYQLIWVVVVAILFMNVFTSMAARIGIATRQSLLSTIREKWGKAIGVFIGIGVFLVTASFQAGNATGIGISLEELTGISSVVWIVSFNLFSIALLFFRGFYKILEKVMILLIVFMFFSFITTMILVKPDLAAIAVGLKPSIPSGSTTLVIAFIASCFSIVGAFYQSYLIQERRRVTPGIVQKSTDNTTGIVLLGLMVSFVIICGATVLYPGHATVNNAGDMARALEPLFGRYASQLFLFGLFGASFSAMIGNATVGGTLLGDALGFGNQLGSNKTKGLIALVMIIGAFVAIKFGRLPLELIVLAQSVTILIVPFIAIAMYLISNDKKIMGTHANSGLVKLIGLAGLFVLLGLAVVNVRELFF
jgi:Mn2+/Fe2+ NRAMP family transporter